MTMNVVIAETAFDSVAIVDDDPAARRGYGYSIDALGISPRQEKGPLPRISVFVNNLTASGVLCDYQLSKRNYSTFNGDELAAALYRKQKPVVMCTAYNDADSRIFRRHRRFIPSLLKPKDADPDNIVKAYELCVNEFAGKFEDHRKAWRTLVRVEEMEDERKYVYAVVPAWDAREKVLIYMSDFPPPLQASIQAGKRLHAKVNLGANTDGELYFDEWEAT